jgi:DNA sulfur modification protein DndE
MDINPKERSERLVLNRIHIGKETDQRLRSLKARTGLTPNLLCRLGFCLSLAEPGIPDAQLFTEGNAREFNRYTLTGQWDSFFFALLRERLNQDGLDLESDLEPQFKAHLNRGVLLLSQRLKNVADLASIVAETQQRASLNNGHAKASRV